MKVLKYGDRPAAEKDPVAEALIEAERRSEALLLFDGRPEHPLLQEEKRWAREEGSAFHLLALRRLGVPIAAEDLAVCARSAEHKGRWLDARLCYVDLDQEDDIRRIAEHLPPSLRPAEQTAEPLPEGQN